MAGPTSGASFSAQASGAGDAQIAAAATGLRLLGWRGRGTGVAGTTSKAVIRHGTAVGHAALDFIALEDNQVDGEWYGPEGIAAASGIFLDREAGDSEITVYFRIQ
jgi:hypothetical protein